MEIGKIIYEKRKVKGLSQEQLAEKLNVSRQTISKWETNETLPDIENLKKLAILLEFSIDSVLEIEIEEKDDKVEWLIIGGFIIGNALSFVFDNAMLGYVFAMLGFGVGIIIDKIINKIYNLEVNINYERYRKDSWEYY